jgi:hypothetical protein
VGEMTDEELFYAWLDGELQGEEAARLAARVEADPALKAKADRHRKLTAGLRGAFEPVMNEAGPPPSFGSAEVIDFEAKRAVRRVAFGVPQWAAMAATLAIGIVAGQFVGDRSAAPVESHDGMLVAAGSLDHALDAQLASADSNNSVRVGLTFRDRNGSICRSFSGGAGSGLACRKGGDWNIEGLFGSAAQGDYRMAAGEDPRLAALIDKRITGEAFDATAEKAALDRGWR